jgi:hypothetical protein
MAGKGISLVPLISTLAYPRNYLEVFEELAFEFKNSETEQAAVEKARVLRW